MREDPSACEWLRRLDAGTLSSRELVEHHLDRIEQVNATLNAVVAIDPDAVLAAAGAADRRRRGGDRAPLLGLPITVKDALDTAGLVTTGGSLARAGHVPERDATVVARIRAAGAIVLAKTNLPEASASYETHNAIYGRTNHPLDAGRTPGGSSGGEAAIIAAGGSPLGIGTDGGGSIRVPSHYCGIAGLRPTVGRTPETGFWPPTRATGMMDLSCAGPMARRVEDLGVLLGVIAGPDDIDPYAVPAPLGDWRDVDVARLRVGFYLDDGSVPVTASTRAAVEHAARTLQRAGADVSEVAPPPAERATDLFFAVVGADGGESMRAAVAGAGGRHHPQFAALLNGFPDEPPPATHLFAVLREVHELRASVRAMFAHHDVLLAPVVSGPAPRHDEPPPPFSVEDYYEFRAFNYTHLHSLAGVPAGSVPAGVDDGLPIGVQVVAAPFREDVALAAMAAIEAGSPAPAPPA